jgi:Ran GTPase-activating protein (RanGAP) involved in mRNA processing and transport
LRSDLSALLSLSLANGQLDGGASVTNFLQSIRSLHTLDVGNNAIGDKGVEALCTAHALTSLDIRGNRITPNGAEILAGALEAPPSSSNGRALLLLQTLNVSANDLYSAGVSFIAKAVATCEAMTELDLSSNHIAVLSVCDSDGWRPGNKTDPSGFEALGQMLTANSTLRSLKISNNDFMHNTATIAAPVYDMSADGVACFFQSVAGTQALQTLDISFCPLDYRGHAAGGKTDETDPTNTATSVAAAVRANCSLRKLVFGGGKTSEYLTITPCCVAFDASELNLENKKLGADEALVLAAVLPKCQQLAHLSVKNNHMGERRAIEAIAEAIGPGKCSSLTSLNFLGNNLLEDAAQLLVDAKLKNRQLCTLCGLGGEEMRIDMAAQSLAVGSVVLLSSEIIGRNNIEETGGVPNLGSVPAGHPSCLQEINLSDNMQVGVQGATQLLLAMQDNETVTALSIANINISGLLGNRDFSAVAQLSEMLKVNSTLRSLDLSRNDICSYKVVKVSMLMNSGGEQGGENVGTGDMMTYARTGVQGQFLECKVMGEAVELNNGRSTKGAKVCPVFFYCGIRALAEGLHANQSLSAVNLSATRLSSEVCSVT